MIGVTLLFFVVYKSCHTRALSYYSFLTKHMGQFHPISIPGFWRYDIFACSLE